MTRLRKETIEIHHNDEWSEIVPNDLFIALADEIERLRAEVARLGSFLHPIGMVVDGQFSSTSETKWRRDE